MSWISAQAIDATHAALSTSASIRPIHPRMKLMTAEFYDFFLSVYRLLSGALLDRITHHVHFLEMNGDSYRLKQSRRKRAPA